MVHGRRAAGRPSLAVLVLVGCVLLAATATTAAAAAAETPRVSGPNPAPGSVVPAGEVALAARVNGVTAPGELTLEIDGQPVEADVVTDAPDAVVDARLDPGTGLHEVVLRDAAGVAFRWSFSSSPLGVERIAGEDRVATAAAIARTVAGGQRVPAAVLARADGFADALAGVVLAHATGGVLLLTPSDALDPAAAAALEELLATDGEIYLLGGAAALGAGVESAVAELGWPTERVAGGDRYATSVAVAGEVEALAPAESPGTAVLASGEDFADALALSVPAARSGWPVLLTRRDELPDVVVDHLRDRGVARVELGGGAAAVSEAVAGEVDDLPGVTLRRTSGRDRYATAAAVAGRFLPDTDGVALANGRVAADALSGGVLAADAGAPLLLTPARLTDAAVTALTGSQRTRLWVLGGDAAVPERAVHDALRATVDKTGASRLSPPSGATIAADPLPVFRIEADGVPTDASSGSVEVEGRQAPVVARVEDRSLVLEVTQLPVTVPEYTSASVRVRAVLATTDGGVTHVDVDYSVRHQPPLITTAEGYEAVATAGPVIGAAGPRYGYSLEVEPATGVGTLAFAEHAEAILSDPRGWTAAGTLRLQRVPPEEADIRILLARPGTVDTLCGRVGLDTGGIYSCWTGRFAALNLDRWNTGAAPFDAPLDAYRGYLVNHEVGHGLGEGHRSCPRPGAPAPVMMQQTKGTGSCRPNAWPYP